MSQVPLYRTSSMSTDEQSAAPTEAELGGPALTHLPATRPTFRLPLTILYWSRTNMFVGHPPHLSPAIRASSQNHEVLPPPFPCVLALGVRFPRSLVREERIFIELITSDRNLKAFREGSK